MEASSRGNWIAGVLLVVVVAALAVPGMLSSQRASNERGAGALLKTLASAEADLKGNDRDKNGVQDFWTGDVAGLYYLMPPGETEPIQLIGKGGADADPSRPGATPWAGYWFAAMDQDVDGSDYRQGPGKDRHPNKFGFCTYPVDRSSGRSVFYINEGNTVFKEEFKGRPRTRWPSDDELKSHYSKMD